jgi:hypothetical protein
MDYEFIDCALGRRGQPPQPLHTKLSPTERAALLERALCFPDLDLPTGELADWAVVLIELGKVPTVMAAVAAVEAVLSVTPPKRADVEFVEKVLFELHIWLKSPKNVNDLRRFGDLWWKLTRNKPQAADTPLGDAAVMAWLVAGYDPEGWGDPPEDSEKLRDWLAESANNVTYIVDVFSLVQKAVTPEHYDLLVNGVRRAVETWRDIESATA